ncbi:MAG: DNA-binding response regulator [Curvibacter sp. GWA2_64_110]|nr:MAG: DNA-binding response regulator [Curvibacter sp. GWA2_64_110]HCY14498.1 DNA-binding response regulator [Curvibacter sp.]
MKILVVDDHALVREGLRQVLKGLDSDVDVLEAGSCSRAFELAGQHTDLDLVLLDYHLPDMNGLEALDVFACQHPELPIIVLSGSVNPRVMRQVLSKGAAAFLTKSGMSDELLSVTRLVLAGDVYVPPELMAASAGTPATELPAESTAPQFTPRQEEVLSLLLDGYANKEIGRMLSLSDETVKNHVTAILRGFGVTTRTQAVLAANRHGYTRADTSSAD